MNRTTINVLLAVVALLLVAPSEQAAPGPAPGPDVVTPADLRDAVRIALAGHPESAREYAKLYQAAAELHDVAHPLDVREWTARYAEMDPFEKVDAMKDVVDRHLEPFRGLVTEDQWTPQLVEQHRRAFLELAAACREAAR